MKHLLVFVTSLLAYWAFLILMVGCDERKCTIDKGQYLKVFEACVNSTKDLNSFTVQACERSAVRSAEVCVY